MRHIQITFAAAVAIASIAVVSCAPEIGAPEFDEATTNTPETSANAAPARTATVALAEFEGFADPATGRFEIERVTSLDPYPQLSAFYEGNGIRTIGQAAQLSTLPLSEPAPWCTGRIVTDGTPGTNPPASFELLTLTGSIGFSPAGDAPNPLCITPGLSTISSFLYGAAGVFCAEVRAHNFYDVPWSDVHAQLYQFSGGSGFAPYALGLGTSVNTNDFGGFVLPEYAGLPDPGGAIALWSYGDLAAGGGAGSSADQVWTFRRASTGTSAFRFRGRVIGNVAENCATADVNEDCDPLARGDNACRLYDTDETCTDDRDCESYICNIPSGAGIGVCAAECAAGLYGSACQLECPGGYDDVCSGNGDCADGRLGSGACTCDANFYGADCSIGCAAGQTWTQAGGCVDAGPVGVLGAACSSDAQCPSGTWCPTDTTQRYCAPSPVVGSAGEMLFQFVPAGTFLMGSPVGELGRRGDETQTSVTLTRNYFVTRTEVTQGQWKALSGNVNPSCNQTTTGVGCTADNANDNGPIERVDWYSAVAYANALSASEGLSACYTLTGCTDPVNGWRDGAHSGCSGATFVGPSCSGYRLLTEAEWERAARGGTTTATYAGNLVLTVCSDTTLPAIAWFCGNAGSRTQSVASKAANAWGLYDMLGNVWEWTGDRYSAVLPGGTDPAPATGSSPVLRSGGRDTPDYVRAASRFGFFGPSFRNSDVGFRLGRSAP